MLELENKNQNLLDLPNPRSPASQLCAGVDRLELAVSRIWNQLYRQWQSTTHR
ncbi:hypothetical protein [Microcoleus sp. CAWBG58]|uniref:hypothetical protein n=1 Tax=Microcoleus sp. CAWBG58 TaxID=2841651 RepID=UPI0025D32838|nr:hypothetical protein [Microcoleus sp. CAWBG58]